MVKPWALVRLGWDWNAGDENRGRIITRQGSGRTVYARIISNVYITQEGNLFKKEGKFGKIFKTMFT